MRSLDHPNIPKLIDFFTLENEKTIEVYLVQEYIKGENLREIVKKGKLFNESDVIDIALKLCNILIYIHSFSPSIIHQDIKPANIIQTHDNEIFLIDFGSAKQTILYEKDEAGLSTILGTQGFMPIEQFEGRTVPSSDIYALGLTLIYLLSGKEPLQLEKSGLEFNLEKDISVSDHLMVILNKMISPDYHSRYPSALELQEDLLHLKDKKNKLTKKRQKVYQVVKSEMNNFERIRWYSKPELKGTTFSDQKLLYLTIITFSLFAFMINSHGFSMGNVLVSLLGTIVMVPYFVLQYFNIYTHPNLSLHTEINFYFELFNKIYTLTDKRLLIISDTRPRKVESYDLKIFNSVRIENYDAKNDKGNLIFRVKNSTTDINLRMVGNIFFVHNLCKELINKSND